MTSNRQDTEASDPIAAPLGPSTPGDSSSVPHTPDLKAEPPGGTPESLSLSSPAKSTPPVHPERNLVGPKIHKHAPKQPIFSSEQRFKDHPEQNTDVIPTSKHLEERWSHNQLAFPVNDASILTFSSRKFPDHDTSDNISPPHDAEFDDDTPDTFPLSRGAPRRRLNNGQPLSPALPKPASSHAQTPPSTNSKFLRPPPLNVGLGTTTRYHPYANAPASEGSIVFHTPSSAPASPRKKRVRSSRHDVPSPIISPYTHGYMHAQDAISPYSPRPDPRGLTPIRQHFANHNLGPNETPQSWNPGIDQQSRQLPLHHQPANAPPRCGSDADQNGFLVLLNAITADMVVANTDIIGQLAAAISNMPIQKTLRSHVVYAAMSIPVMQLRDAFSKVSAIDT